MQSIICLNEGRKVVKAGILTFHFANNYGAVLQTFALQQALLSLHIENEIIDYRCPAILAVEPRRMNPFSVTRENGIIVYAKNVIYNTWALNHYGSRRRKFEQFRKTYLSVNCVVCDDSKKINENGEFSAFVCGSDQIWNAKITNGYDDAYFCAFPGASNSSNIAYAASCGKSGIGNDDTAFFNLLNNFNAISVRERSLAESLKQVDGKTVECVLDPTLLVSPDLWNQFPNTGKYRGKKYIILYMIEENAEVITLARKIAAETGLEIYEITTKKQLRRNGIHQLDNCGPEEFVDLFRNCSYVVTNSFHGTCFSLIFEKSFVTIPHSLVGQRMIDLLHDVGLDDCITYTADSWKVHPIEYVEVKKKIELLRSKSTEFLKKFLLSE